jgi:DNA-binding response OmpR family regulator
MTSKKRVMIIEDDPDTIELLGVILELRGYEPIPAYGGQAGLKKLEDGPVDLILLDLMMDDIDGWTVLGIIKADEELKEIPVIILSVKHQLEDLGRAKAHEGQFVGYMVKPFNMRALLAKIADVLGDSLGPFSAIDVVDGA